MEEREREGVESKVGERERGEEETNKRERERERERERKKERKREREELKSYVRGRSVGGVRCLVIEKWDS